MNLTNYNLRKKASVKFYWLYLLNKNKALIRKILNIEGDVERFCEQTCLFHMRSLQPSYKEIIKKHCNSSLMQNVQTMHSKCKQCWCIALENPKLAFKYEDREPPAFLREKELPKFLR